ncbi:MAG: hypothetical protein WKF36_01350 [Candidatus Nitrosocosmicus sp.]
MGIIRLTRGGARLLPTIIEVASGFHTNSAILYIPSTLRQIRSANSN